jgi:hypothetical protein
MLSTGILIGFAALCHLPSSLLIVWLIVIYTLYTGATVRHYSLLVIGVLLPNLLFYLYWFWHNAGTDYTYNYLLTIFSQKEHLYLGVTEIFLLLAAPVLFFGIALARVYTLSKFINYQSVMLTVMVLRRTTPQQRSGIAVLQSKETPSLKPCSQLCITAGSVCPRTQKALQFGMVRLLSRGMMWHNTTSV